MSTKYKVGDYVEVATSHGLEQALIEQVGRTNMRGYRVRPHDPTRIQNEIEWTEDSVIGKTARRGYLIYGGAEDEDSNDENNRNITVLVYQDSPSDPTLHVTNVSDNTRGRDVKTIRGALKVALTLFNQAGDQVSAEFLNETMEMHVSTLMDIFNAPEG